MNTENIIKTNTKQYMLLAFKVILLFIVFYFVYKQFSIYWSDVIATEWSINYLLLTLSVFAHLIAFLLFSKVWCILIKAFGFRVKLSHAFKISYITSLGRYIPGKLWPVVGMSYLAKQLGISEENAVVSWIVALIFTLPSAFLAVATCIFINPEIFTAGLADKLDWTIYLMAIIILFSSLLLIMNPNLIFNIINIILKKLKRPLIELKINVATALQIYIGYYVSWLVFGFAFWLFINSITQVETIPMIPSIAAFILAYQVGYLAFFAPGGIGVRELVLTTILVPYIGPVAASISIAARIWNMITEIISAIIAVLIKFPKNNK